MNNNANNTTTGSHGSTTRRSVSGDASLGSDSSLSSLQSGHSNALSNNALHDGMNVGSEDARINRALSEHALSKFDNDTIMNDSGELLEFDFSHEIQPLGLDLQ